MDLSEGIGLANRKPGAARATVNDKTVHAIRLSAGETPLPQPNYASITLRTVLVISVEKLAADSPPSFAPPRAL